MPPRILLTSFEPFGGRALNSSHEVASEVARANRGLDLHWHILPVVAGLCVERAWEHVLALLPDFVVALGQATGAAAIRLEQLAINVDHYTMPDNAGNQFQAQRIAPGAPLAYESTLPAARIEAALRAAEVPVERSWHAGTYVCNHLLFGLLHRAATGPLVPRIGFVHLPLLPEQLAEGEKLPGLARARQVEGVGRALRACVESLTAL